MKTLVVFLLLSFSLQNFAQNLIPYRLKNLWGYCDTLGNIKITPMYTYAHFFEDGVGKVELNGKQSLVDTLGKLLFGYYDEIEFFKKDIALIKKKGKLGLAKKDKIIVPAIFDDISFFSIRQNKTTISNKYFGKIKNKNYIIDLLTGKYILAKQKVNDRYLPPRIIDDSEIAYDNPDPFFMQFINKQEVVKIYDSVIFFNSMEYRFVYEQYFKTYLNGKVGLVYVNKADEKNIVFKILMEPEYDDILYKKGNYIVAIKGGKVGVIENFTMVKFPFIYDKFETENNGSFNPIYLYTIKNNLKGFLLYDGIYPPSDCKYSFITYQKPLYMYNDRIFHLFRCTLNKGNGYVGENGVAYFKD